MNNLRAMNAQVATTSRKNANKNTGSNKKKKTVSPSPRTLLTLSLTIGQLGIRFVTKFRMCSRLRTAGTINFECRGELVEGLIILSADVFLGVQRCR